MTRPQYNAQDPIDVLAFQESLSRLTETNRAIAEMVMAGYTQAEIGEELGISQPAISKRIAKIMRTWL